MRNSHKIAVIFLLIAISNVNGQQKLKGNKIISSEDRNISGFTSIEVIDNLNVILEYNDQQSVTVEADSNLQSSILTELNNGKLTLRTNEIIGRNKALNIHIKVNKKIKEIKAFNKAKITSKNSLSADNLTINSFDNSVFNLNLNSKNIEIYGKEKSKLKLKISSETVNMRLEKSCNLTATINTKEIRIIGLDNASTTLKGTSNNLEIEFSGDTSFNGIDLIATNGIVKSNNNAKLYVHITNILNLYANNSSEIHVYANPKITVHEFYDKALIRKKELD